MHFAGYCGGRTPVPPAPSHRPRGALSLGVLEAQTGRLCRVRPQAGQTFLTLQSSPIVDQGQAGGAYGRPQDSLLPDLLSGGVSESTAVYCPERVGVCEGAIQVEEGQRTCWPNGENHIRDEGD